MKFMKNLESSKYGLEGLKKEVKEGSWNHETIGEDKNREIIFQRTQNEETDSLLRYEDYNEDDEFLAVYYHTTPEWECALRVSQSLGISLKTYLEQKKVERVSILKLLSQLPVTDSDVLNSNMNKRATEVVALKKAQELGIRPYDYIQKLKQEQIQKEQPKFTSKESDVKHISPENEEFHLEEHPEIIASLDHVILYQNNLNLDVMGSARRHHGGNDIFRTDNTLYLNMLTEKELLEEVLPKIGQAGYPISYLFSTLDVVSRVTLLELLYEEERESEWEELYNENLKLMERDKQNLQNIKVQMSNYYYGKVNNDVERLITYNSEELYYVLKWMGLVSSEYILDAAKETNNQDFIQNVEYIVENNKYFAAATILYTIFGNCPEVAFSMYEDSELELLSSWLTEAQKNYDLKFNIVKECLDYYLLEKNRGIKR